MIKMPDKERALGMYEKMYLIRAYEEEIYYLFNQGIMPGTIHQSHGQEACAVGMLYDTRKEDIVLSTHRPAGEDLVKGVSLRSMMCEMFGKEEGCCKGRGGAMHTGDINVGVLPANAIVGNDITLAAGVGLALKMKKTDNVAICFFGDGASNEGAFHEGINGAAIWNLPIVFVCENNRYSATTSIKLTTKIEDVAAGRAASYGIPGVVVDGNDVLAVNKAAEKAIKRARKGEGPTIIELKTYRRGGHSRNDACGYRPKEEEEYFFNEHDPVKMFRERILKEKYATEEELAALEERIENEIEQEVEYASKAPYPSTDDALQNIYWEGGNA